MGETCDGVFTFWRMMLRWQYVKNCIAMRAEGENRQEFSLLGEEFDWGGQDVIIFIKEYL